MVYLRRKIFWRKVIKSNVISFPQYTSATPTDANLVQAYIRNESRNYIILFLTQLASDHFFTIYNFMQPVFFLYIKEHITSTDEYYKKCDKKNIECNNNLKSQNNPIKKKH